MSISRRIRDLMELARISNLPTCLTNVLVGAFAGGAVAGASVDLNALCLLALAICLMYVGGMALNDAIDAPIDREQRSGRPIPSGRIARRWAFALAGAALAAGLVVLSPLGPAALLWGVVLAATIVAYDLLHKKHVVFCVLMGACRGLVYVVAGASVVGASIPWPIIGPIAVAMTVYIVLVTIIARSEARSARSPASLMMWLLPFVLLAPVLVIRPVSAVPAAVMGVVMTAWILLSGRHFHGAAPARPRAIMGWLAGICLADGWYLALLDRPDLMIACLACFLATTYGHQRILGT